ncbi:MAG: GNAT family N-acetyltransferase [Chloroflexi bacterium]|nr:GNAT family N-acetyltransferase [Chloroflexota bacterium]
MTKPVVRKMISRDKPAVISMLRAIPQFLPMEVDIAEEVIDGFLADPSGSGYRTYVAVAAGTIAGYVCFGQTPMTEATWDVYWIAVSARVQGQGIGRMLMSFAEDEIRRENGRLVVVETSSKPNYDRTRRFYDGLGYQKICVIEDFYATGDGKVIYVKRF